MKKKMPAPTIATPSWIRVAWSAKNPLQACPDSSNPGAPLAASPNPTIRAMTATMPPSAPSLA